MPARATYSSPSDGRSGSNWTLVHSREWQLCHHLENFFIVVAKSKLQIPITQMFSPECLLVEINVYRYPKPTYMCSWKITYNSKIPKALIYPPVIQCVNKLES